MLHSSDVGIISKTVSDWENSRIPPHVGKQLVNLVIILVVADLNWYPPYFSTLHIKNRNMNLKRPKERLANEGTGEFTLHLECSMQHSVLYENRGTWRRLCGTSSKFPKRTVCWLFVTNVPSEFHEEGEIAQALILQTWSATLNITIASTEVLKAYEDARAAKDANVSNLKPAAKKPPGLTHIGEAFKKSKKFAKDDPRAKAIEDLIMDMMALDDQPFTLVEDRGFSRLINHLEPRFTLPSRRYFSDVCLPAKYDAIAKCIHTLIDNDVKDISFTMDVWTCDVSPVSMMSLTAQWLNTDFKL